MDFLQEDVSKIYYNPLISQWINDAKIIENEVQLLIHQTIIKHLNE